MRKAALLIAVGAAGAAVYWLAGASRAFVEKAEYKVVEKDGPFEVRDYPALEVATALVEGDGGDRAFGRLFRFISGNNERREKISMTAPVFMDRLGGRGQMSFVMPAGARQSGVPEPADALVRIGERPPQRVAVFRFGGRGTERNEREAHKALREWMRARGLEGFGTPVAAYYDAPFIPPPFRRNEVMLRLNAGT